jgi:tetratricopeptide (TPR) repeat protein
VRPKPFGIATAVAVTVVNAAYIAALPSATVFYVANVLLHIVLGAVATFLLVRQYRRAPRTFPLIAAALVGLYLIYGGATFDHRAIVFAHIGLAVVGLAILLPRWTPALAVAVLLAAGLRFGRPGERIRNPNVTPINMQAEGEGPKSPFWPSSARTNTGGVIPSDFFTDSKLCGECHKDIYEQWKSSMHHFASFNNQFYRASILHMQELSGTQGSKWCAGCHDHAVFFNGRFEKPIKDQLNDPEAQNGLGCVSCHSIVHVGSTMGQGDFEIRYPPLHKIANSHNPILRKLDAFITYLNPEPHRLTFMKAYMRGPDNSEYCATCHKVHLDEPVNHYRWIRGFNEYDNWQASGISGQGARSFYYPPKSAGCGECHMPLVASRDPGNRDGKVHSHRFAAANTAVPSVNHDESQLAATQDFLKTALSVDIFAASPVEASAGVQMRRRPADTPALASTFAVGEEAEQSGPIAIREVGKIAAPLDAPGMAFQPGSRVRVDAVVRTRKVGHFFPGGTIDGFDVWVEFRARDANGRVLADSGSVADNGRGPVDKGAHFYRAYLIDSEGNPINKRNAWQARSTFYVRLIPPGAADTVHYVVEIPKDAAGPITLEARVNYRKFTDYFTKFSFAGVGHPKSGTAGVSFDNREFDFNSAPVPTLPITVMASKSITVPLGEPKWQTSIRKQDRERWNDWGIGMLLQGDLKGAEYAFQKVIEAEPSYVDGYVNVARALIQEGETEAARPYLEKALALSPKLARAEFFLAMAQKAAGDYAGALASLADVRRQYPRDRVVINQYGRIEFLQRNYAGAVQAFEQTLAIDPEDLQAHYNLMLCYRGLGRAADAEREETLFRRFKADESSQALTQQPRLASPADNNERQAIHDHDTQRGPLALRRGGAASD